LQVSAAGAVCDKEYQAMHRAPALTLLEAVKTYKYAELKGKSAVLHPFLGKMDAKCGP